MQIYMNQEKCIAQIAQRFLVDHSLVKLLESCGVCLLNESRPTLTKLYRLPGNTHFQSQLFRQFLRVCFSKRELTSAVIRE